MSNKSSTKRSLVFSVLSLLLCLTMLVGTTFAWFTDSVTSGKNQIVAGNLDVAFEYYTENGWADVEGKTDLVDPDALWEPGHAEVVYLKVSNVGTLALKYRLALNVFSEVLGVNKEGKNIKLSEYLKYGVLNDVQPGAFATREEALEAVEKDLLGARKLADHSEVASLLPEESDTFALVIWMPTTVGNEANHNGVNVPSIELGVSVAATQFSDESDSFDRYYDRDAFKPVANVDDAGISEVSAFVNMQTSSNQVIDLDTAYAFLPTETYEEAMNSAYKDWHADFVVTIDKDVKEGEAYLAGYYSAWCDDLINGNWMALTADLPANTPVRLVENLGATVSYWEICQYAMDPANSQMGFLCGAGDVDNALAGATLTVELRLYEVTKHPDATSGTANDETGEYITIGTYSYTFAKEVASAAEVESALDAGIKNIDANGANIGSLNYALTQSRVPAGTTVTISNAVVEGKSYGNGVSGTVIFEGCTFTNTGAYSIHFDNGNGDIIFKNCTLEGWCSFGSAINSVTMENCTLKGNGTYGMYRFYQDTTMTNCVIDCSNANQTDVYVDGISAVDATVTMKDCTLVYCDLEVSNGKIVDGDSVLVEINNDYKLIKNADR